MRDTFEVDNYCDGLVALHGVNSIALINECSGSRGKNIAISKVSNMINFLCCKVDVLFHSKM